MSVVNKMLQDLEARQADGQQVSADYQAPKKRPNWLWLIALLGIAFALFAYWLLSSESSPLNKPKVIEEVQQTQPQKPVAKTMLVVETTAAALPAVDTTDAPNIQHAEIEVLIASAPNSEPSPELSELTPPEQTPKVPSASLEPEPAELKPSSFQITGSSQVNQTASLKQQIKDAVAANNNELAIKLLNKLLDQQPDDVEASKKLAALLFANGNNLKATTLLQSSLQNSPHRADLRMMLARLYVQQKKGDAALVLLKEVQPAQYMEIDYLALRASVAQQQADFATANQDYATLSQVDSNNARWWLGLAICQEKLGVVSGALNAYYRAQNLAQLEPAVTEFIEQRIRLLAGKP